MLSRFPLSLGVLASLIAMSHPAPASDVPRPESAPAIEAPAETLRFDLYQGFVIVVHGSAGSLKNLNFFLDTGTNHSTFDSAIASKLNLRDQEPSDVVMLGGREQAVDAVLPTLRFGPVEQSDLEIITADLSFFRKALPVRIDAIVGLDVLGQRPFVIDYSTRTIRFGPSPPLAITVPLRRDGGLAVFDAEIDHRPVRLAFDTGAGTLVLFNTDATPRQVPDTASGRKNPASFENKQVELRSVRVGTEEFRQEPARLARNPQPSQFEFDGLMSPAALGISRVSVNLAGGILQFSR